MQTDLDVILANPKPYTKPLCASEFTSNSEDIVVMHLRGPLVQGAAVSFFLEQVRLLIGRGACNLVIDLLDADSIDNRGVGGLAAAYNSIHDARGTIKFVIVSTELLSALCKNQLDRVFEIYQDGASALDSFKTLSATRK